MASDGREAEPDDWSTDQEATHPNSGSQRSATGRSFVWGTLLVAGWLVFEITHQPVYGAAVACSKLIGSNIATAFWAYRNAIGPAEKWALFAFHLSVACARYACFGILTAILIGVLADLVNPRQAPHDQAGYLFIAAMCGAVIHWFLTWTALYNAIPARIRLYYHPDIHEARRTGGEFLIRRSGVIRTRVLVATGCGLSTYWLIGVSATFHKGLLLLLIPAVWLTVWVTRRVVMPMDAVADVQNLVDTEFQD